jgi:hypothetical protein
MMMQCPRCSTRWRVAAAAPPEPDTLEFIFPERQPAELLLREEPASEPAVPVRAAVQPSPPVAAVPVAETTAIANEPPPVAMAPEPPPPLIIRTPLDDATTVVGDDAPNDTEGDGPAILASDLFADPVGEADEPELTFGERDEDEGEGDDDDAERVDPISTPIDTGRRVRVEDTVRAPAPAGFGTIMRAMGTVVAGFAALALMIRVAPERTSAWLSRLPVAGAGFARDRNLATKVELTNVQGRFQRLRNARRVFVISGDARNNSPMTIERIEVEGALYGLGGGEVDQKVVTTGNRTPLTDLSEAEITLLQRLDPVIALAPGQSTPFLIVFVEPPRELREFSSRVLSVRPTRRASNPPARSSRGSVG